MDEVIRDREQKGISTATHNPFADLKSLLNKKLD